jgi:hypothetical protein
MSTPTTPSGDEVPNGSVPAPDAAASPVAEQPQQPGEPLQQPSEPLQHPAAPRTVTETFADHLDNDGFFSSLFDITFTKFVTRKLAGPVYVVGLTLIGLGVVFGLFASLSEAIATHSFWGVLLFLLDLLITVVGAVLAVLLLRVGIEVFVAVVAIAENTRPRRRRDLE